MRDAEDRLDHRQLKPIVNARSRVGEVSSRQIRAQDGPETAKHVEARFGLPGLDVRERRLRETRRASDGALREAGVLAQSTELLAECAEQSPMPSRGLAQVDRSHGLEWTKPR
jgi:hypothetical protein